MTGRSYETTALSLFELLPSDEWQNVTLTPQKIGDLTAGYLNVLDNTEIFNLNKQIQADQEIKEQDALVRDRSLKAGTSQKANEEMYTAFKRALFRRYLIVAGYAVPKYFSKQTVTGRGGK